MNRFAATGAFLASIIFANYVTSEYGLIPVGFGLTATAGTYFAGAIFVLRDAVQDAGGKRWAAALVLLGALLSWIVADPFIALASGVAFLASEAANMGVYTPLRRRGYVRAAVASNVVAAIIDTYLFLWVAGFPVSTPVVAGQLLGKLTITAVVVVAVASIRSGRAVRA